MFNVLVIPALSGIAAEDPLEVGSAADGATVTVGDQERLEAGDAITGPVNTGGEDVSADDPKSQWGPPGFSASRGGHPTMTSSTLAERLLGPTVGVVLVLQALVTLAALPRLFRYYPAGVGPLAAVAAAAVLVLGAGLLGLSIRPVPDAGSVELPST